VSATRFDPDTLAALEEERDFLLRSLDDLEREREAGDIDDDDYRTLRDDYTARAAAVLRAIDDHQVVATPMRRRPGRTVVAVVVVAAVALGAGFAVAAGSGTRRPGQGVTGGPSDDTADRLLAAAAEVRAGDVLAALELYDAVLAEEPAHAGAMTYKGWLLVNVGADTGRDELTDRGRRLLEEATATHPGFADAWFFYGFYLLRVVDDPERAEDAFLRALASDPVEELAVEARRVLAEIEDQRAGATERG
jgi:hypothetical protein